MRTKVKSISELQAMAQLLEYLRITKGPRVFNRWLRGLKIYEISANTLTLTAPTPALAEEISLLFGSQELMAIAQMIWPEIGCIRIKPAPVSHIAPRHHASQLSLGLAA